LNEPGFAASPIVATTLVVVTPGPGIFFAAIMHPLGAQTRKAAIVQAPLAHTSHPVPAIVHQAAAQLPWKHHCLLVDKLDKPADQPSIGLILCRAKNRIIAEYALRDLHKPIGVSDYVTRLVDSLPKALQAAVPSIKEIESGLTPSHVTPIPPRKP
jgi:hypothetical protein